LVIGLVFLGVDKIFLSLIPDLNTK
jgi:hypothetical protein